MPYKISGTLSDAARVIIIKESDWSIESNTEESAGAYEVDSLVSGAKLVAARKSDGESLVYGNVTPKLFIGDRGVFGGGYTALNNIDYITISSTGNGTDFGDLTVGRNSLSAASNGANDRGIFGGGTISDSLNGVNVIDYITISAIGNAQDFGDSISPYGWPVTAVSNGTNERGVFAGHCYYSDAYYQLNIIDYITISSPGNSIDFGDLTVARGAAAGTSNGTNNRGVFGAGMSGPATNIYHNIIDYITISSTGDAVDFGDLNNTKRYPGATSNGTNNRGLYAGGIAGGGDYNMIDYITISSTGNAIDFGDLTVARRALAAVSNGTNERGVFGGGSTGSYVNIMDYVTISSAGNAVDFGDLTINMGWRAATSNA